MYRKWTLKQGDVIVLTGRKNTVHWSSVLSHVSITCLSVCERNDHWMNLGQPITIKTTGTDNISD